MREAIICVPARNEALDLPRLLRCLAAQRGVAPPKVLVLANNCTDDTADLARGMNGDQLVLRVVEARFAPASAHAGSARRAAMAAGAAWLGELRAPDGVLLSTDADALPPPCWLAANLAAIEQGAEAVGGRILPEDSAEAPLPPVLRDRYRQVERYWRAVRAVSDSIDPLAHDPAPRHGSHTGGSLAVTLPAFEAAGGVPACRNGEDNALVAAIERDGGRLRHAPAVWITVSARREGRAEGGMAAELRRWEAAGEAPMMLPAATFWRDMALRRRWTRLCHAQLRHPHAGPGEDLAAAIGLPEAELAAIAAASRNDIAFVARVEARLCPPPAPLQEIGAAILAMESLAVHGILAA